MKCWAFNPFKNGKLCNGLLGRPNKEDRWLSISLYSSRNGGNSTFLPNASDTPIPKTYRSTYTSSEYGRMSETPFRPREVLREKQKYFQKVQKHTYLKGPFDKITSVAIPAALAATSLFMIGRGIYNMSHGIGKKE
ncbi:hypothetical protein HS088_TW12G00223 [Tripterygium wilfordii]|uniref:Uncharacterized protein n=1 Tax=Tripterygium wilfordii TaxID=458696 RepID=A0A7J7CYU1_TRIWF|nr:uncharacterized protein LOC120011239 [Tripterygium wilfordii]KAF5739026.1 hypothetical protein HS088_TW12G00223 [Tripterygium wilfordii]